jgi:RHS repeat-associated protein
VKVASPSETISRQYDAAGQLTCVLNNSAGLSQGVVWYYYNSRGWVTTQYDLIDGTYYTTLYGYDFEGKLTYVWSMPVRVDYSYDAYDRVSTVRKSPSTTLLTVTYNKDDTVSSETTGDGTKVTTYGYNSRDWISSMVMKLSGTVKLCLQYSYDDVGNVRQLIVNTTANAEDAQTEVYTYDWLDRIRTASGGSLPSGLTYDYDAVGNADPFAGKTCTYGSYNKLSSDDTWSYSYDGNGNLAWKTKVDEHWRYTFNSLDQLVKAEREGTTQGEYWYGPTGMMIKSLQGGTMTRYVYHGHDPLMEKTGSTSTYYVYVNGRMFAKIVGSTTYFYIKDALGSTRQVWQGSSMTFSVATYKPFGTPVSPSGTERFEYAGELIVSAAGTSPGLYYIGARWMDPELGRWISLDPELGKLSMPQTMNRYVYCGNNPLRFTDPTGRFWNIIGGAIAGATFGLGAVSGAASKIATTVGGKLATTVGTKIGTAVGQYAGTAFAGAVAGSVSGAAGYAITTNPSSWTAKGFLTSVGLGAAFGSAGAAGGKFVKSLLPKNIGLGTGNPWDVEWKTQMPSWGELGTSALSALPSKVVNTFFKESYKETQLSVFGAAGGSRTIADLASMRSYTA